MLYLCYDFMEYMKIEPSDYDKLFEYLRYRKTKSILKQVEYEFAKAMQS